MTCKMLINFAITEQMLGFVTKHVTEFLSVIPILGEKEKGIAESYIAKLSQI